MGLLNTRPGGGDLRGSLSVVTILSFSVSMGLRAARSGHSGRSVSGAFSPGSQRYHPTRCAPLQPLKWGGMRP